VDLAAWKEKCAQARGVGIRNAPILVHGVIDKAEAVRKLDVAIAARRARLTSSRSCTVTAQLERAASWLKED